MVGCMFLCIALLVLVTLSHATAAAPNGDGIGVLLMQEQASTEQMKPVLSTLSGIAAHVALCQMAYNEETALHMEDWSKRYGIRHIVYEGERNLCLASYRQSGLVPQRRILLLEWNMHLEISGPPSAIWQQLDVDNGLYGVAPDVNGLLLDWTPILLRVEAKCGFLGRLICVDNSYAHNKLLRVRFELDEDRESRELIEDAMVREGKPLLLKNITITRKPPQGPSAMTADAHLAPPADTQFAHGWYWLGRALEDRGNGSNTAAVQQVFSKRFELPSPVPAERGEIWYAGYRIGALARPVEEAVPLLLDSYNRDPRRREPLAVLTRKYREADKYTLCRLFGLAALSVPCPIALGPDAGPHIELHVYEWTVVDDTVFCLSKLGEYDKAAKLLGQLLAYDKHATLPTDHRLRLEANLKWIVNETEIKPPPSQ